MTEDEILDFLGRQPLSSAAGQRVALAIVSHLPSLEPLELDVIARFKDGDNTSQLKKQLWANIDASDADSVENARQRLFVCVVSDRDRLDDQLAEMLYYWAQKAGLDGEIVSMALERELA